MVGLFLAPLHSEAGLLASFFGNEAVAAGDNSSLDNSQNMTLLQVNAPTIPILKDKKAGKDAKNKEVAINDNGNTNISSDNALQPATSPVGVTDGTDGTTDSTDDEASVYVVHKGDSLAQIADMFNVSVNTILLANDMKKGQKLVEGDVLLILPISGVEHTVTKGQTIKGIAKLYKADPADILAYNGLPEDVKLSVGDKLLIPGGDDMADEGGDKPAPNLGASVAKDKNYYITHPLQNLFRISNIIRLPILQLAAVFTDTFFNSM